MGITFTLSTGEALPDDDYRSRAIVDGRGALTVNTGFMGVTSCEYVTIAGNLARWRDHVQRTTWVIAAKPAKSPAVRVPFLARTPLFRQ